MKPHYKKWLTKRHHGIKRLRQTVSLQIFREADKDFYKIDHGLFAPAVIIINNAKTGEPSKQDK
jgi:hypothetical protein